MTISLTSLATMLILHWIMDFIVQTDWQAKNKSTRWDALLRHTCVYSLPWLLFGFSFWLVTFLAHTATDYVTSRVNSRLWKAGNSHWFFVSIGFDQLLHYAQLFACYLWLVKHV